MFNNTNLTRATNIGHLTRATNSSNIDSRDISPYRGKHPGGSKSDVTDAAGTYTLEELIPLTPQLYYDYFNISDKRRRGDVDKAIHKYRSLLYKYILERHHFTSDTDRYLQLPLDEFKRACGAVTISGTNNVAYIVQVIHQLEPQYKILEEGNNKKGKVTLVELNRKTIEFIKLSQKEELLIHYYKDVDITDPSKVDLTPIDMNSLRAFIKGNENLSYQNDKTKQYLNEAKNILYVSELTNGVLPQIISESNFGRRYYSGLNLQNTSKIVRDAALGNHYQYDLNSAAYAIKLNLVSYLTKKKFTYTSEYIENGGKFKDSIRKRLAKVAYGIETDYLAKQHVTDKQVATIKSILTMIGFGATITGSRGYYDNNGTWRNKSIIENFGFVNKEGKTIITEEAKKCYQRLINDEWFKNFAQEQTEMTKLLVEWYEQQMITKETHPFLLDGRNCFNKNKTMAYIFQTLERGIMDDVYELIIEQGNEVLLRVHDAIFTKRKIKLSEIHEFLFNKYLSPDLSWLGKSILSFEETSKQAYYYDDNLLEHKKHIREEELFAKGYKSLHTDDTKILTKINLPKEYVVKKYHEHSSEEGMVYGNFNCYDQPIIDEDYEYDT